jgi:pyruvate/2-oxoglutarate dehydrogenase complex dihydrolipoamide dehydrogenase (E3) component
MREHWQVPNAHLFMPGCVPKKIMYNAAHVADMIRYAALGYGLTAASGIPLPPVVTQWDRLKAARDAHVRRINDAYAKDLVDYKITHFQGHARFIGPNRLMVSGHGDTVFDARHILIATGVFSLELIYVRRSTDRFGRSRKRVYAFERWIF